jgi:molybdate transport system ATP-binding protein
MTKLELDVALDRAEFRLAIKESLDLTGITAVFGPSGSGKTSLLRVIAGLEPRASGSVSFRSESWQSPKRRLPPEARAAGFVFQDGRLFAHLSVRGNLSYPLKHGRGNGPMSLDAVVDAFDLAAMLERYPAALSGGERQRVAIARALLANPALLLMDEPLSSLDVARKRELIPLIKSLPARFGLPILYVTHDVDELVQLADEVLLLSRGQSVGRGSPRSILERRDFEQVAGLADPGAVLEASVLAHTDTLTTAALQSGPAGEASAAPQALYIPRLRAEIGDAVRLVVHARDVILALEPPAKLSIRNRLAARVVGLQARDDGQLDVVLAVGAQQLKARITRDAAEELALAPGQAVLALIKTVALDGFARS